MLMTPQNVTANVVLCILCLNISRFKMPSL